ncbi:MAG: EAL domain-containing protein [Virgibacillus proomii]
MNQAAHFISILKRSTERGLVVSIYSNQYEPEKCSVGYVDTLSTEQFIMKHITPEGLSDGYIVRRLDDIFRVDFNGEYEKRIDLLYTLQQQKHESLFEEQMRKDSNLFKETFISAKNKDLIVSICMDEGDDIVGFVKDITIEEVVISRISSEGLCDGESSFFLDDVNKLNCDTVEEKTLKLLYNYRNND